MLRLLNPSTRVSSSSLAESRKLSQIYRISAAAFSRTATPLGTTLGIRRENKNRWERRVPLSPQHVQALVDQGINVLVQPSNIRIFSNESYERAGAKLTEDLDNADVIIGVKEVPNELLIPNKTYMFFSHVIKAQPHNMPMLDTILANNIRLIDYERIVDQNNNRLVRFGRFAGIAGMIDFVRALGTRLLSLGHSTPFLQSGYAHMYPSLEMAQQAIEAVGEEIALKGVPANLAPMVFVFTGGEGNCSKGAREIFEKLPHRYVKPEELPHLIRSKEPGHRFRLYGCIVGSKDYMEHNDPSMRFSKSEYYAHPERYHSVFHEKIAPYASVIVNNLYWDQRFPRILTRDQMKSLYMSKKNRLIGVADITCDPMGSIESLVKVTTIDEPIFVYDPKEDRASNSIDAPGVMFLAVDNLPTELPLEASVHFGESLLPFLPAVVRTDENMPLASQLPTELATAVITDQSRLTPAYNYIQDLRLAMEKNLKRVLVLGAGLVTPGLINILCKDSNVRITIASMFLSDAEKLAKNSRISAVQLDADNEDNRLERLIPQHDVIVSCLPQTLHPKVAKMCIKHRKHMVTASYVKPEMQQLHKEAVDAGITILNEIGLDPGIDHMSAIQSIETIKSRGGRIKGFRSVCGGLPAPEYADNPFYYKFSWNPKGVLLASMNPAKFLRDNDIIEVRGEDLMLVAEKDEVHPCFSMEVLPNRDSVSYIEAYGLQDAETVFRGTLRFKGFAGMMWSIRKLGLLDSSYQTYLDTNNPQVKCWPDLLRQLVDCKSSDEAALREAVHRRVFEEGDVPEMFNDRHFQRRTMRAFEWLGFFDRKKEVDAENTLIDTTCNLLKEQLAYAKNERDMILMQHTFDVEWNDGRNENLRSTLIAFGQPEGESAMSKTVGYPLAIATKIILDGLVKSTGVLRPISPEIYTPLLAQLHKEGIWFVDNIEHKE